MGFFSSIGKVFNDVKDFSDDVFDKVEPIANAMTGGLAGQQRDAINGIYSGVTGSGRGSSTMPNLNQGTTQGYNSYYNGYPANNQPTSRNTDNNNTLLLIAGGIGLVLLLNAKK